ncbi:hypothetical protein EGT81_16635 [Alcaligenes faecalis]|uniref:hypothetical protein n=1 Tax=Alcaligenes faecalis TaxID=511 RepID=UPI000F66EED4|nr:hypothetical protein [Alcaligenes faecalis]RSE58833.1 hypothetical protein EGT81_16635 [Alcaligenes faecalis]
MSKEHTGLPNTPEEIRAFIGKSFSSLQFGQDNELPHENDTYTLTAHDLISAFQWAEIDAPMSAEPTDDEIIDIAVEPLGIDCDRMPYGVVVFARALLSRYSSAPVAAQPDVTQQTLDDVMAGIPARDAEIEALRKEIEALQAAPVKPYSLDLDPAGIRALTADAISGALALGFQGVSPPPNNEHWLAPFWEIGRESAAQVQQPVSGADGLRDQGKPWSGWACQYPGKLPRLYGDKAIAELNHHPEEGDRLFQLAECAQQDGGKVDVWQCTTTLQESDDLIWLYCQDTNTIDGPVKSNPEFIDAWTHWAWVEHPSTAAIDAARKEPDQ